MCSFGPTKEVPSLLQLLHINMYHTYAQQPSVGIVSVTETTAYIVELEGAIGSAWHVVM